MFVLTIVSVTGAAPPVGANTTYRYRLVALAGGDAAANYDCHSTGCDVFSPGYETRVDWGLSMIFSDWGNVASIKRTVKARGSEWKDGTEAKYLAVEDNADAYRVPETDSDTGVKNPHYWCDINLHLRLYAPVRTAQLRGGSGYNWVDGYWVVGTTHKDYYEEGAGCSKKTYWGDSEGAENAFVQAFRSWGFTASSDVTWMDNEQHGGIRPHLWNQNGYASRVRFDVRF